MRSGDLALLSALVAGFAVLVTVHLCIVVGLFRRTPRWRGVAALLVLPLAPYWALRARMYVRGVAWLVAAAAYGVALGLSGA